VLELEHGTANVGGADVGHRLMMMESGQAAAVTAAQGQEAHVYEQVTCSCNIGHRLMTPSVQAAAAAQGQMGHEQH
jgi:hypothetical protein